MAMFRNAEPVAVPLLVKMLVCSFLWASAFILLKLAGTSLSPFALTALRGLMGGGLIALFMLAIGQSILPKGREFRDWIVLGLLQGVIPNVLTAYALTQITAGLTSMIQASSPLIVAILAQMLFTSERLTLRRILGLLIGFAGMAILIGPSAFGSGHANANGIAAMIATAVSYAVGSVYVRSIPIAQPLRLAFGQQIFSGLPTFAGVLLVGGSAAFAPALDAIPLLLVLGVFGTALPIVLFMNILRTAGPTIGSMNGYFQPPWTILLGFMLLGEPVSVRECIGVAIVLVGVATVSITPEAQVALFGRIRQMIRRIKTALPGAPRCEG